MKRFFCLALILAVLLCCSGCEPSAQQTLFCMDTVMELQIWGKDAEEGLTLCQALLQDLEALWSVTDPDSVLNQLDSPSFQPDPSAQALLLKARQLSEHTGGAFAPTLGAVTAAWGFYDKNYHVPSQDTLDAALSTEQWDLGGALKGYAGSACIEVLQDRNIDRAILNLGGNIQTYGEKADGSPWQIGIQNPTGGNPLGILSITGTMAVVTSGDYQRYFEENGVRYHHIIDPATGYPADSGLTAVTVLCADGMTADALSTALFVMGLEKGTEFWRQSEDFEAVFVTTEGQVYATEGAALTGCEYEVIAREN